MELITQSDSQGNPEGLNHLGQYPLQQAERTPRGLTTDRGQAANTVLQTPLSRPRVEVYDMFTPNSAARSSEVYDATSFSPGVPSDTPPPYEHDDTAYVVIPQHIQ